MAELPCMKALLAGGTSSMKNPKYRRLSNSLQWRQCNNKDSYDILMSNGIILTLDQVANGETKGLGTGTFVWPAAHVLAKYIDKRFSLAWKSFDMVRTRIIEIGAGTGCVGLAAAALGAQVTLTDQECVTFLMETNKQKCQWLVEPSLVDVAVYNWGESCEHLSGPYDIVLVSDCILPKLYPIEPLVEAVRAVMSSCTIALFSYEHRVYPYFDPRMEFKRLARKHDMQVRCVPMRDHDDKYCCDDIEIWEVTLIRDDDDKDIKDHPLQPPHHQQHHHNHHHHHHHHHHHLYDTSRNSSVYMISWGEALPRVQACVGGLSVYINQNMQGLHSIGCYLWSSSVLSARLVFQHNLHALWQMTNMNIDNLKSDNQIAVELGSGCGLTSLALYMRGYNVFATDKSSVVPVLTANISEFRETYDSVRNENNLKFGSISALEYDWVAHYKQGCDGGDNRAPILSGKQLIGLTNDDHVDLVMCSDCCYDSLAVPALLFALQQMCDSNTVIVLTNECRTALDEFLSLARHNASPLVMQEISLSQEDLHIYENCDDGLLISRPMRMFLGKLVS